jgi:uracil-DNA glycosylase
MVARAKPVGAQEFFPAEWTLEAMRAAARRCQGCALYQRATQTVFGEGPATARIMMIGEQPGDQEDKKGHPFVGPAGRILDKALIEAEIDRGEIYLTNAVKHFKWKSAGGEETLPPLVKKRLHDKPSLTEVKACKPWLHAELELVAPELVICLGATAISAVFARKVTIADERGRVLNEGAPPKLVTVHPSAIVRIPERERRKAEFQRFVEDLIAAREFVDRTE